MRELDDLDRAHGLGALPGTRAPSQVRRPARRRLRTFWTLVLTTALLTVVIAVHPGSTAARVRDVVTTGLSRAGVLGTVGDGSYAFIATQPGGREPVGYDPCTEITVAANSEEAPANWETLVERAIEHVGSASGLDLAYIGETDSRDGSGTRGADAMVLVMWATAEEFPALEGSVAGVGGSSAAQDTNGRRTFVEGRIVLDRDAFRGLDGGDLQIATDQAVVDHELGHVVGLDHVDDPREIMNDTNDGRQLSWGPGDRKGLALLGEIPCS